MPRGVLSRAVSMETLSRCGARVPELPVKVGKVSTADQEHLLQGEGL